MPSRLFRSAFVSLTMIALLVAACGNGDPVAPPLTPAEGQGDAVADDGETVQIHYTGTLDDGSVFDSSRERGPFSFVLGAQDVIAGFDAAVRGMRVGETKTVRIEPAQAYGERTDDLVFNVPRDQLGSEISVGDALQSDSGAQATILAVSEETVSLDANHPLAGLALTFEIELLSAS